MAGNNGVVGSQIPGHQGAGSFSQQRLGAGHGVLLYAQGPRPWPGGLAAVHGAPVCRGAQSELGSRMLAAGHVACCSPCCIGPGEQGAGTRRVASQCGNAPLPPRRRCRRQPPPAAAHSSLPPRRCLSLLPWPAGRGQVRERGEVKSGGRLNWRHACHLTMQCCAVLSVPARLGTPLPPSRFCSAAAAAALTLLPLLRLLCLLCCRI